jgi:hypothetical protein
MRTKIKYKTSYYSKEYIIFHKNDSDSAEWTVSIVMNLEDSSS